MRSLPPLPDWVALEHDVAQILTKQELHGWYFDTEAAWKLASSLRSELEETCQLLRNRHPFVAGSEFTPKRNNKTSWIRRRMYFHQTERDQPNLTRPYFMDPANISWLEANPDDTYWEAHHRRSDSQGYWDTDCDGFPSKCLDITKKLGMISEGTNAWLKLCTTADRIHHHCSVATNTHRCAHRKPNPRTST